MRKQDFVTDIMSKFSSRSHIHRIRVLIIVALVIVVLLLRVPSSVQTYAKLKDHSTPQIPINPIIQLQEQISQQVLGVKKGLDKSTVNQYWDDVFAIYRKHNINVSPSQLPVPGLEGYGFDPTGMNPTKGFLEARTKIPDSLVQDIKRVFESLMTDLPKQLLPSTYKLGSSGIVMIGGGRFSWLSYLSILSLRRTGSNLPVEVILPTYKEYEEELDFCKLTLPKLNAMCIVAPEVLGESVMISLPEKFKLYQYKSLAIISSTFQNVFLLDSDNIVLRNPDHIFNSKLYQSVGLITWPDYWRRSTHPVFYNITNTNVDLKRRTRYNRFPLSLTEELKESDLHDVPYHDLDGAVPDLSTESGQLFINKKTHGRSLLLATYFNMYGPKFFYRLLGQGAPGDGDKDTFIAAAHVLGERFYQVKSYIQTVGHFEPDGFHGVAMLQKDPLKDFEFYSRELKTKLLPAKDKSLAEQVEIAKSIEQEHFTGQNIVPPFTVHCNFPKLDPLDLMSRELIYNATENRLKYKMFNGFKYISPAHEEEVEFEHHQWLTIEDTLCHQKVHFSHFDNHDLKHICQFIANHLLTFQKPTS